MNNNMAEFDDEFLKILDKSKSEYYSVIKFCLKQVCFMLILCVFVPYVIYKTSQINGMLIFVMLMPFVIFVFWFFMSKFTLRWNEYVKFYKEIYIGEIVRSIDKNFSFYYKKYDDSYTKFGDMGIPRYVGTEKEDFISGNYKNVNFEYAEFCGVVDIRIWFYVYRGIIFSCDFYKDFKFNTKIINKKILHTIANLDKLDNVEFNDFFHIISQDKIEARYLLTPSFMERLNRLNSSGKFKFVSAAFLDSKFYLFAENNKNLFEVEVFIPPNLKQAQYFRSEIVEILSIIDELNLTLNIYPKTVLKNQKLTH